MDLHNSVSKVSNSIQLDDIIYQTRNRLLRMHYEAHTGHIGPNLSALEIMMTLFHVIMDDDDRFILSKGHAAGAYYSTLWSLGLLSDEDLTTFCQDNTLLAGHPHGNLPTLMFPTGSLGHGPGLACGLAIAARHQKSARRIWCLCGDGEWEEGSCWEALTFAAHHNLQNLTYIIDCNGLQGFGKVQDIVSVHDWSTRLQSFGAHVTTTDGHAPTHIRKALLPLPPHGPAVVLCKTIKGRGLKNAGEVSCHYLPLSDDEYRQMSYGNTQQDA